MEVVQYMMTQTATFGGGCFWCTEAVMQDIDGVQSVVSGYAGGDTTNPTYREVCSGRTGHAEVVQVEFDESKVTLRELLRVFFATHNPETRNREGPDVGSQYRSIVLPTDGQRDVTEQVISDLEQNNVYNDIVTEVSELTEFYRAEEKHQDFFNKNPNHPYCRAHIPDKLSKLKSSFPSLADA